MAMQKLYQRINWENYPSDRTPLNERNLNRLDVAVNAMDDRIINLDVTKLDRVDAMGLITSITLNPVNGVFTITYLSGATATIDTMLEKLAVNFDFDERTQELVITMDDGTKKRVDLSAFITDYEFLDSDTVAFQADTDGKVTAIVKEGSIQEKHLRPDYLADIRVESSKAEASATVAKLAEDSAKASEEAARGYKDEAKTSQEAAGVSEENAAGSAEDAAASAQIATEKAEAAAGSEESALTSAEMAMEAADTATRKAGEAGESADSAGVDRTAAERAAVSAATDAESAQQWAEQARQATQYKQDKEDNSLETKDKTIVGAINEVLRTAGAPVTSVNGKTGAVNIGAEDIGALKTDGDASETIVEFEEASERDNINTGESTGTIIGKIKKWFSDMTTAAFAQVISSKEDLLANMVGGYLVDALVVKEIYNELTTELISITVSSSTNTVSANGNIDIKFTAKCPDGYEIIPYSFSPPLINGYLLFSGISSQGVDSAGNIFVQCRYHSYASQAFSVPVAKARVLARKSR